jgi:hypothetical protein
LLIVVVVYKLEVLPEVLLVRLYIPELLLDEQSVKLLALV